MLQKGIAIIVITRMMMPMSDNGTDRNKGNSISDENTTEYHDNDNGDNNMIIIKMVNIPIRTTIRTMKVVIIIKNTNSYNDENANSNKKTNSNNNRYLL